MSTNLKQVIMIRSDVTSADVVNACIAKASLSLVTRCFENSKDFLGRTEAKDYTATIIDWVDNHNMNIEIMHVSDLDCMQAYEWTSETMGIPAQVVSGEVDGETIPVCMAMGPFEADQLDAFLKV